MEKYLHDLNEEQRFAVQADGNVLITACPGSGKTRVLAHKLAYELSKVVGKKILIALTYTNRAADELHKRINNFDIDSNQLWTGTIHSFCLEWILKPYQGYAPQIAQGYEIIDEWDSERLISELKKKHGMPIYTSVKKNYKLDGTFDLLDDRHLLLVTEYKRELKNSRLIDFDDILYYAYQLLIEYPPIAERLSKLTELICVDEYQDTQELQYAILAQIVKVCTDTTRIFFVGDISQAIYGSLGGVAKTASQIEAQFGGIKVMPLQLLGNYRSSQRIIDYYTNYQLTDFKIKSQAEHSSYTGHITFNSSVHRDNVHGYVANIIRHYIDKGVEAHEICVLAPQWRMVIPMGRKLKSELPEVDLDAFGLSPFRKVRENLGYKIIRIFLSDPGNHNYLHRYHWIGELIKEIDDYVPNFLSDTENRKRYLLRLIRAFNSSKEDAYEFIAEALIYFFAKTSIEVDHYPELKNRVTSFLQSTKKELSSEEFDYANETKILKRLFNTNRGVVINTCHGVKGEEFEVVIAFGLLHGYLPNWGDKDVMASKKLLYVICSRAKKYLHLIAEQGHSTRKGSPYWPTSELEGVSFSYDSIALL